MDHHLHALNRFGLGARAGERYRIGDAREWLLAQVQAPMSRDDGKPNQASGALPPVSDEEIGEAIRNLRAVRQGDSDARKEAGRRLAAIAGRETTAGLTARIASERPFIERLVGFWSNHLCISAGGKALVAPLAGSYEREVIRPHLLGRFEDMVLASAKHPAMLVYLDNFQSIGPHSLAARRVQRTGRQRGLNENYARELLELHTLGVDGGYAQADVQELARMMTGWTLSGAGGAGASVVPTRRMAARPLERLAGVRRQTASRPGEPIRFAFVEALHEPGDKTVLGHRFKESGVQEGERGIRLLCRHPATARFVATKLATHFVSDDPPPAAVERIAKVFSETDGDLAAVARALVHEPDAWRDDLRKFRTPQDWLVAVMRALGANEARANAIPVLRQLRQPLWSPPSPKGYGDRLRDWADPDSLLNRAELARTLSRAPGLRDVDPVALLDVVHPIDRPPLQRLLEDRSIAAADRLALTIAGPAFHWR